MIKGCISRLRLTICKPLNGRILSYVKLNRKSQRDYCPRRYLTISSPFFIIQPQQTETAVLAVINTLIEIHRCRPDV